MQKDYILMSLYIPTWHYKYMAISPARTILLLIYPRLLLCRNIIDVWVSLGWLMSSSKGGLLCKKEVVIGNINFFLEVYILAFQHHYLVDDCTGTNLVSNTKKESKSMFLQ